MVRAHEPPSSPLLEEAGDAALIPHPSSLIPHPSSLIPHPSSLIPHPSSLIPHPSSLPREGQVLLAGKLTALEASGGGEVQMLATGRGLRDLGLDAHCWRPWEERLAGVRLLPVRQPAGAPGGGRGGTAAAGAGGALDDRLVQLGGLLGRASPVGAAAGGLCRAGRPLRVAAGLFLAAEALPERGFAAAQFPGGDGATGTLLRRAGLTPPSAAPRCGWDVASQSPPAASKAAPA